MTRKPSISRRNRINWHYVRYDALFSTIKVVSRHQTTQQYGAILPIERTTDEIWNSKAYKEYYACAMGEATPKPKASARKKKGESASFTTPPTPTPTTTVESAPRLSATAKGKQPSRETTPIKPTDIQRTKTEQLKIVLKRSRQETHISQQNSFGTDKGTSSKPGVSDVPSDDSEEELSTPEESEEESNNEEDRDLRLSFRFEERLRSLETSFSEYRQTNPFADAVSAIPGIVQQFMTQQMMKAVREAVQIQTDRLQDSLQREMMNFFATLMKI
nr:hypothetical protein [Tanacetum cinerariifolium]